MKKPQKKEVTPAPNADIIPISVDKPPLVIDTGNVSKMGYAKGIRNEMKRIYRMAATGKMDLNVATKFIYMLQQISRSQIEADKLEILEKGGIMGTPFVGVQIFAPAYAHPPADKKGTDDG